MSIIRIGGYSRLVQNFPVSHRSVVVHYLALNALDRLDAANEDPYSCETPTIRLR